MRGLIDPDLLFPAEERTRALARRLYAEVSGLPIVSPHGHTEPRWYALDEAFPDPAQLLIVPDHYVFRMLFSQGIRLEELGVPALDGSPVETDGRAIWRRFCENYHLFRGTPTRLWFDYTLSELFGIDELPSAASSDRLYDHVAECLTRPDYRPRALYERFNIEVISTTDSALDDLGWHAKILESGWKGRVVPAYRPDAVVDPDFQGFPTNLDKLGDITGADTGTLVGLSGRPPHTPRLFQGFRRDLDGSRPCDRQTRPTFRKPRPRHSSTRCGWARRMPRSGACSGRRC